jgi:hypothetical protein
LSEHFSKILDQVLPTTFTIALADSPEFATTNKNYSEKRANTQLADLLEQKRIEILGVATHVVRKKVHRIGFMLLI